MQKYFISEASFIARKLEDEVAFQIMKVLRCKTGDCFLVGVNEKTYSVEITKITSKEVFFEVLEEQKMNHELPIKVDLYQGFPKGDKLEDIIKYGTQLGISAIYPVFMKRSIVKLDETKRKTKRARYQKIAQEAAEQALRNKIPLIGDIQYLKEIDFTNYKHKILCYEESAKEDELSNFKMKISSLSYDSQIAVVVGPEGGIDDSEKDFLEKQGFVCVGLGPRILRTETVVFYVLSAISYEWELKK